MYKQDSLPGSKKMTKAETQTSPTSRINYLDALLYLLAGGAMFVISISFLLWLRF